MTAAERGEAMLGAYAQLFEYAEAQDLHPDDVGSFLGDLLADLLHYSKAAGVESDWVSMAHMHFYDEQEGR